MSTTMTMLAPPNTIIPAMSASTTTPKAACCPNCGHNLPASPSDPHEALLRAQRQIADLESQIQILNQKANAAVDRWADYEDELSRLRAASMSTNTTSNTSNGRPHPPAPSAPTSSPRSSFLGAGAVSRISQLLSPQRSNSAPAANAPTNTRPSTPAQRSSLASVITSSPGKESEAELRDALTAERQMREAAEAKLDATSREVEDLSATLFEQANEMVATERRRAAQLEQKIEVLGQRDAEKTERMKKLEGAVQRIERARSVLGLREEMDDDGFLKEKDG
ncbi:hypothetical protein GGR57DRAFT_52557 [Xylariaceae sp. FL1272]|nr:hypothetical protein GGR57DRAFT_52557 [Xylariaceae sp. FL1272]